jgi:hypothetical protein
MHEEEKFSLQSYADDWQKSQDTVVVEGTLQDDGNHYLIDTDPCQLGLLYRVRKEDVTDKRQSRKMQCQEREHQLYFVLIKKNVPVARISLDRSDLVLGKSTFVPSSKSSVGGDFEGKRNGSRKRIMPWDAMNSGVAVIIQCWGGGYGLQGYRSGRVRVVNLPDGDLTRWKVKEGRRYGGFFSYVLECQDLPSGANKYLDGLPGEDCYLSPGYATPPHWNAHWLVPWASETQCNFAYESGDPRVRYFLIGRPRDGRVTTRALPVTSGESENWSLTIE